MVKGLVGDAPKTAWVIDYPLLERIWIYYLLVVGYDVYGNAGHQLNSRLYMDFLRMEGEFNLLVLLPQFARLPTADYWYREARQVVTEYVYGRNAHFNSASDIDYKTRDPQRELYGLLRGHVAPVLPPRFELSTVRTRRCDAICSRCPPREERASPGCRGLYSCASTSRVRHRSTSACCAIPLTRTWRASVRNAGIGAG